MQPIRVRRSGDEELSGRHQRHPVLCGLDRLLRPGVNTLSRWEAGRVVQTASLDVLPRLLGDLPGSTDDLKRHAA